MYKRQRLNEAILIIKNLNFLAVGKGAMKPEPEDMPGLYDYLAEQIWINNHFWFAQKYIRGKMENAVIRGLESNFAILYPHLTKRGKEAHRIYIAKMKKEFEESK